MLKPRDFKRKLHILAFALFCFANGLFPLSAPVFGTEFSEAVFHEESATVSGNVLLDKSCVKDGYVAVSVISENRLKFQVLKDDITYTYDIFSDGTPSVFPLQSGDGEYTFRVMENVTENKYAVLYSDSCMVSMPDPFAPFVRPSDYVFYTRGSECVRLAEELSAQAEDTLDLISKVYDYVCSHIVYDVQKAATVQAGYLPYPDETLASGKGICFDYASLAASMLRSQHIPVKVIFGYVSPEDLYHAWNMFYTEETGWITVDFRVSGDKWNRMDLTFAANGADSNFIGDGSNYSDVFFY